MAETLTANYGWTKPDPGASANTWGATLNATTDKVDAQVWANQQAGLPVGGGCLWFTPTPPTNFLIADGSSLDTTTYATLFGVYGYRFGGSGANFNLPPLAGVFPFGANTASPLAATGGEATHVLTTAEMPAHPHPITDLAHTHGASQPAHTHGDQGHGHPDGGSYQDAHNHTVQTTLGSGSGLTNGGASFSLGSATTSTAQPAVHAVIGTGYANLAAAQPAVTVNPAGTGLSTTQNAGGGAAHNNLPPFLSINFIVRYQ